MSRNVKHNNFMQSAILDPYRNLQFIENFVSFYVLSCYKRKFPVSKNIDFLGKRNKQIFNLT